MSEKNEKEEENNFKKNVIDSNEFLDFEKTKVEFDDETKKMKK